MIRGLKESVYTLSFDKLISRPSTEMSTILEPLIKRKINQTSVTREQILGLRMQKLCHWNILGTHGLVDKYTGEFM